MYGAQVMGLADAKIGEQRQSVATSHHGNTKVRSTYLVLLAEGMDPGIATTEAPVLPPAKIFNSETAGRAPWAHGRPRERNRRAPWRFQKGTMGFPLASQPSVSLTTASLGHLVSMANC